MIYYSDVKETQNNISFNNVSVHMKEYCNTFRKCHSVTFNIHPVVSCDRRVSLYGTMSHLNNNEISSQCHSERNGRDDKETLETNNRGENSTDQSED